MKILHIYRTYFPDTQGGLEEAIRQICLSTTPLTVENRVLTLQRETGDSTVNYPEATVYRSPRHISIKSCDIGFTVFPLYKELLNWCDIVHYHFPWPFADLLELIAGGSKPYIVTYHSDIIRQKRIGFLYRPLMNRFLKRATRIVATSENYFASSSVLSQHSERVDIVPLGIDEAFYPSLNDQVIEKVEQRFGRDFFLFIGVFRYYKGLHILLEAIKGANYKVIIAGSGNTEIELKEHAARLQLDNVEFPGYVSNEEKMALLSLSKGIVFPSYLRSEAFGMTLLEGALMSKPLISTEIGTGTSHVNIDHETGLVVAPGSTKELREAMDYIHKHPEEAQQMGKNARLRYEKNFTGKIIGKQYVDIYSKVLSEAEIVT